MDDKLPAAEMDDWNIKRGARYTVIRKQMKTEYIIVKDTKCMQSTKVAIQKNSRWRLVIKTITNKQMKFILTDGYLYRI